MNTWRVKHVFSDSIEGKWQETMWQLMYHMFGGTIITYTHIMTDVMYSD